MVKQTVVHPVEYYSAIKQEQTILTCNNLDESTEDYAEWIIASPQDCMTFESTYITFLKSQNYRNKEQIGG